MTQRYWLTMFTPWLLLVFVVAAAVLATPKGEQPDEKWFSLAPWATIPVGLWTALGWYGVIAVWLSNRQQKAIAQGPVQISKTSWHYKLNSRLARSSEWEPETQCQYVALTLNNLGFLGPLKTLGYTILYLVKVVVLMIAFMVSLIPSLENFLEIEDDWIVFDQSRNPRQQWVGPVLGVIIPVVLLLRWDAEWQPIVLGAFLTVVAGIILHKPIWFVLKFLWLILTTPFKWLFMAVDFLLIRRIVCKPAQFV